jgi:hypothetical protein
MEISMPWILAVTVTFVILYLANAYWAARRHGKRAARRRRESYDTPRVIADFDANYEAMLAQSKRALDYELTTDDVRGM